MQMGITKTNETMEKKDFYADIKELHKNIVAETADSLHELGARIENDDLLDEMQDGRVTVSGDHYTAEITEVDEQ